MPSQGELTAAVILTDQRPRYRSDMDLSLFFAGTAGSAPGVRRGLPAVLVRRGGDRLLFDCG